MPGNESQHLSTETWSPRKQWLMGITATLIVAALVALGTLLFNWVKIPILSERERVAVYSLINDIKTKPTYLNIIYPDNHDVIDSRWRKARKKDSYFESAESVLNLFQLGYGLGQFGDAFNLLDPKYGQVTGQIKNLDIFKINGQKEAQLRFIPNEDQFKSESSVNLHDLQVYSADSALVPNEIIAHVHNLDIPQDIRESLNVLINFGKPISTRKTIESRSAFMVISIQSRKKNHSEPEGLDEEQALYFHGSKLTAYKFVVLAGSLANSIQKWADKYSIDLNTESKDFFQRYYR